jgi:hypothetical protein
MLFTQFMYIQVQKDSEISGANTDCWQNKEYMKHKDIFG